MTRNIIAIAFITIQFCFLTGWAVYESVRLHPRVGKSILVRTRPVDPRDLLRGQYMRLAYEFSFPSGPDNFEANDTVWVLLQPEDQDGKTYFEPVAYYRKKPAGVRSRNVLMRGTATHRGRIEFDIEKYFVPEGTETPSLNELTVRLRVGADHRPRIEEVYRNGIAWP